MGLKHDAAGPRIAAADAPGRSYGRPAAEATRGSPTQAAADQAPAQAATAKSRIRAPKKEKLNGD